MANPMDPPAADPPPPAGSGPTYTAEVTEVTNVGSPSRLDVQLRIPMPVMGSARVCIVVVPVMEQDWPAGQWPPRRGDKFPVTFRLGEVVRG